MSGAAALVNRVALLSSVDLILAAEHGSIVAHLPPKCLVHFVPRDDGGVKLIHLAA